MAGGREELLWPVAFLVPINPPFGIYFELHGKFFPTSFCPVLKHICRPRELRY